MLLLMFLCPIFYSLHDKISLLCPLYACITSICLILFFSSCLAFTPEVNPLSYSQIVTVQRDDVDVDESQSISISNFKNNLIG